MNIPESDPYKLIFYEHYPSVRRKLAALVRDESAADDLAQEVLSDSTEIRRMIPRLWGHGCIEC